MSTTTERVRLELDAEKQVETEVSFILHHPIIFTASLALVIVCLIYSWKERLFGIGGWIAYALWCFAALAAFTIFVQTIC